MLKKETDMSENMPMREKYWEEKSIEDKLESLANLVEFLCREQTELHARIKLLSVHSHSMDGAVSVPLKSKEDYVVTSRHSFLNKQPK